MLRTKSPCGQVLEPNASRARNRAAYRAAGAYGAHSARLQHRRTGWPSARTLTARQESPRHLPGGRAPAPLTCWLSLHSTSLRSAAASEKENSRWPLLRYTPFRSRKPARQREARESHQLLVQASVTKHNWSGPAPGQKLVALAPKQLMCQAHGKRHHAPGQELRPRAQLGLRSVQCLS